MYLLNSNQIRSGLLTGFYLFGQEPKCFSQMYTRSVLICFLKSASTTRVLVISLKISSLHFVFSGLFALGSLNIPTPLVLRHVPQFKTEQLSPAILNPGNRPWKNADALSKCTCSQSLCARKMSRDIR